MSQQEQVGANATFEVCPAEQINGKSHQLVFTRVHETPDPTMVRIHAIQAALDIEEKDYSREVDRKSDRRERVLATAAIVEAFLNGASA